VQAARHLVLLAPLLVLGTALFILTRRPIDRARSISMHVGDAHHTFLLFAVASTLGSAVLSIFMWLWIIPALQLGVPFIAVLVLAMGSQLAAAWIRYIDGRQGVVHSVFAYGMAVLMPILLGLVAASSQLTALPRVVVCLAAAWMVASFVLLFTVSQIRNHYLFYQSSYVVSFYIALLAATYF
jgi:hypothetical protein